MRRQRKFRAPGRVLSFWDRLREIAADTVAPLSRREKFVYSLLIIGLLFVFFARPGRAFSEDEGKLFRIAPAACESENAWLNPGQASGQPDSGEDARPSPKNSAVSSAAAGALLCNSYEIDREHTISQAAVTLYMGQAEPQTTSADGQPKLEANTGPAAPELIDDRPEPVAPNGSAQTASLDRVMIISTSRNGGDSWQVLHRIDSSDLSPQTLAYSIALPGHTRIDSEDFALKLETVNSQGDLSLFLDSAAITYRVARSDEVSLNLQNRPIAEGEIPALAKDSLDVEIKAKDPRDGVWQALANKVGGAESPGASASATIKDSRGRIVEQSELQLKWQGSSLSNANSWLASLPEPDNQIEPGRYTLEVVYTSDDGRSRELTRNFLWGVLAINTDKDVYYPGESGQIMLSVLDELGKTVCDSRLELTISSPSSDTVLTSQSGQLAPTDTCDEYGDHITADYVADYNFDETGEYTISLKSTTDNGSYVSEISARVEEKPEFSIERSGPTRVYPVVSYPMTLKVNSENGFKGTITEYVPVSFEILPATTTTSFDNISRQSDLQAISWNVNIPPGGTVEIGYRFDAPDISPEFYTLGPAELTTQSDDSPIHLEAREWQIAGDAVGRMIMFYDGASTPAGWTCVSCGSGDPFYQAFVKGAVAYGGTGGSATHAHTASTDINATAAAAATEAFNSGTISDNGHSHTFSPTLSSPSNLPSYRQLKLIRYDTTGEPATLPTGVVGIFDTSVPSGWTRYSAQDGSYIRGENTVGATGGSNTHTVSISGTTSQATGSTHGSRGGGSQVSGAAPDHTHTVSGSSAPASNEPPYLEVVLGQLDSADTPPNGLIAMWDEDPATGWNSVSDSGDDFNGRYIKPASAYGSTGGSSSHTHSDTTGLATSGPSTTGTARSGGSGSNATHTHSVDLTGYSTENQEPPYREVLFAKRNAITTYTQSAYRWYENDNSTDVSDPLAAQDTAATAPARGTPFRLRMAMHVTVDNMALSHENFKLQYAERSGTCDPNFTGESYADVATSTGGIRYHNNAATSDGDALTANANDPSHSSDTMRPQTYEEANNFTNSQAAVSIGEDGYWDFSLVDFEAPGETPHCFRIVKSDGTPLTNYDVIAEVETAVPPPSMILLWDGASIPSGWLCISCDGSDDAYQRFLRGEAVYGATGGSTGHSHTASGSVAATTDNTATTEGGSGVSGAGHTHSFAPTIEQASNLPNYRQLKVIMFNGGTPSTIPAGAIALFDASVPSGWTRYSAQDGSFVRGEDTAGTAGGSNTHNHPIAGDLSAGSGDPQATRGNGPQTGVSQSSHTHDGSGTSGNADQQPPFVEVILGQADSDTSVPGSMIAMWDKDPGGTWECLSCGSGDPLYQRFFKPAAAYGATGGSATHNHTNTVYSSGGPSITSMSRTGSSVSSDTHTHEITVSSYSTENHLPPYINVTFYKSPSSNTAPDNPSSLVQEKTDTTNLSVGDWTNESFIVFKADVSDTDNPDTLSLCVEFQPVGTPFTNTEAGCGSGVNYTGTAVEATYQVGGLVDGEEYHWQARVKDALGSYSSWISFGGNAESARDFAVDTSPPTGTVYDGSTAGVDTDYNGGSLDTVEANWNVDSSDSGVSGYEYSIGTTAGATDVTGWTSNGTADSMSQSSLNLQTSQLYFVNVRTTDIAGNQSIISSDGLLVSPTLSFSSSAGAISFGNLNAGNGYTGTETTTLTTSTNAYNGYYVRAYATGLLDNGQGSTIPMFSGGTYAAPDEWLGSDIGYGIHSSDSSVDGSNRFNSTPCAGGGNPPCYAPVSLTAPGDIIADHTSTVSGTPVFNEQFTITHRVTSVSSQDAGTYVTVIVYSVTARY